MRKNILGLVVAALAFSTFGAFAQQETTSKEGVKTEQCCKHKDGKKDGKKECKKDSKDCKKGKDGKRKFDGKRERPNRMNPFTGIGLTAEQQQKIDQLRAEQKAKSESRNKESKEARKKDREAFNASVEKILTPEQYAKYKANCDSIKAHKQKHKHIEGSKSGMNEKPKRK